jgi:hypothetical protein
MNRKKKKKKKIKGTKTDPRYEEIPAASMNDNMSI